MISYRSICTRTSRVHTNFHGSKLVSSHKSAGKHLRSGRRSVCMLHKRSRAGSRKVLQTSATFRRLRMRCPCLSRESKMTKSSSGTVRQRELICRVRYRNVDQEMLRGDRKCGDVSRMEIKGQNLLQESQFQEENRLLRWARVAPSIIEGSILIYPSSASRRPCALFRTKQ